MGTGLKRVEEMENKAEDRGWSGGNGGWRPGMGLELGHGGQGWTWGTDRTWGMGWFRAVGSRGLACSDSCLYVVGHWRWGLSTGGGAGCRWWRLIWRRSGSGPVPAPVQVRGVTD